MEFARARARERRLPGGSSFEMKIMGSLKLQTATYLHGRPAPTRQLCCTLLAKLQLARRCYNVGVLSLAVSIHYALIPFNRRLLDRVWRGYGGIKFNWMKIFVISFNANVKYGKIAIYNQLRFASKGLPLRWEFRKVWNFVSRSREIRLLSTTTDCRLLRVLKHESIVRQSLPTEDSSDPPWQGRRREGKKVASSLKSHQPFLPGLESERGSREFRYNARVAEDVGRLEAGEQR